MLKDVLEGKPFKHPLHPFLVHFPIGLFTVSFLFDIVSLITSAIPGLVACAFYSMLAGVIMSLLAAVPGFVDYTTIRRDHPARKYATAHMVLNLLMVGSYAVNVGLRASSLSETAVSAAPFILSCIGITLLGISGYLGGTLVYDDGIGVGRHRREQLPEQTLRFGSGGGGPERTGAVFVETVAADRIAEGSTLRLEVDGQVMVLARSGDHFFAVQEFCTHRYGPLSEGKIQDCQVMCPWHGSCFDLKTGKVTEGPAKVDLKTFPVEVRNGKIWILIRRDAEQQPPQRMAA